MTTPAEPKATPGHDQLALRWHRRIGVQRRWRLVQRLVAMSPAEVVQRVRLKLNVPAGMRGASPEREADLWLAQLGAEPLVRVAESLEHNFFYGPQGLDRLTRQISAGWPGATQRLFAAADGLLAGDVRLLGQSMRLEPAQWTADPVSGALPWPMTPLGELDEAAAILTPNADPKYVWELGRMQFLTTLGRAHAIAQRTATNRRDEDSYGALVLQLVDSWIEQNPVGEGIHWCSHLEVAMRAISWLWTLPLVLDLAETEARGSFQRWLRSLAAHYDHLRRNLSIFTDPTNHLIGETTALWMLATCLPNLPDAAQQSARCRTLLLEQLHRQVSADGVNHEQASSYHRFVMDFYLQFAALDRIQGRQLPPAASERLSRMVDFAASLAGTSSSATSAPGVGATQSAEAPMIGDSDDARGIPFLELVGWSFADSIALGRALFGGRTDSANDPVCSWILGAHPHLRSQPPLPAGEPNADAAPHGSRVFREGGYAFLRSQGGNSELIFDCGPLGLWPNAAHGHADALSVQLRQGGVWLLGDPGTGTYFGDPQYRDAMRRTAAHNTLTVDGLDQADILDVFKWVNPMSVICTDAHVGAAFDFVSAEHDGYERLRHPVRHRRAVLSLKRGLWFVIDWLQADAAHHIERWFQAPPQATLQVEGRRRAQIEREGRRLTLEFVGAGPPRVEPDPDGVWSTRYGERQTAPRLRVADAITGSSILVTCLHLGGVPRRDFEAQVLPSGGLLVRGTIDAPGHTREQLWIHPHRATAPTFEIGDQLATTAEVAYAEFSGSQLQRAVLVGGCDTVSRAALHTETTQSLRLEHGATPAGRYRSYERASQN